MINLSEPGGDRTVVGIRGHDIAHMRPPALTFWGLPDRIPADLIFDLGISK